MEWVFEQIGNHLIRIQGETYILARHVTFATSLAGDLKVTYFTKLGQRPCSYVHGVIIVSFSCQYIIHARGCSYYMKFT